MTVSVVVISPKRIDGDRKLPLTGLELNEAACFIVGDDEETAGSSLASFTGDRLMLEVKRQLLLTLLVSMGPKEALERRAAERWSATRVVFLFGGSQPRGWRGSSDDGKDLFATVREIGGGGRRACVFCCWCGGVFFYLFFRC